MTFKDIDEILNDLYQHHRRYSEKRIAENDTEGAEYEYGCCHGILEVKEFINRHINEEIEDCVNNGTIMNFFDDHYINVKKILAFVLRNSFSNSDVWKNSKCE